MTPELHPLTQKYPPMEAEEFAAFLADLAAHGQKNPIWLFEGKVLDGRNRLRACLELGLEPVFAEFAGTEAEAAAFVDSQNLHRRHLSREWRQQRVREMRSQGMSYPEIAEKMGCGTATAYRDVRVSGVARSSPETQTVKSDSGFPHGKPEARTSDNPPSATGAASESCILEPAPGVPPTRPEPSVTQTRSEPDTRPTPESTRRTERTTGRDGKSYRAERPAPPRPNPAPKEKAQWTELATVLTDLARKVETLVPPPAENERPWELISSLEATARSLLRQADRLKRRHHL